MNKTHQIIGILSQYMPNQTLRVRELADKIQGVYEGQEPKIDDHLVAALSVMDRFYQPWDMEKLAKEFESFHPEVAKTISHKWVELAKQGLIERTVNPLRWCISNKGRDFLLTAVPVAVCA